MLVILTILYLLPASLLACTYVYYMTTHRHGPTETAQHRQSVCKNRNKYSYARDRAILFRHCMGSLEIARSQLLNCVLYSSVRYGIVKVRHESHG